MAAYLIANLDIHEPDTFQRYRAQVTPLIAKFGGRYIVRGGDIQTKEGDLGLKRLIVLEFPDMKAAEAFYSSPEYQPVMQLRLQSATSSVALVPGSEGTLRATAGARRSEGCATEKASQHEKISECAARCGTQLGIMPLGARSKA